MKNIKMAKAPMIMMQGFRRALQRTCGVIVMVWIGSALYGQVVFQNSAFTTIASGPDATSISMTYTPGTAANKLMIVAVTTSRDGVNGVTFDGEALELIGNVVNGNSRVVFFYLVDPPAGPATLQASLVSDSRGFVMGAATFSNVNQITPLNTFKSLTGASLNPTITDVATSAGSIVFSAIAYRDSRMTLASVGAGQVERWNFKTAASNDRHISGGSTKVISSGTTTSVSYTFTGSDNTDFSAGAVSINPIPSSDLSITKTVNNPTPFIGQTITFTLTASNLTAGSTASLVNVNDLLPDGYTFVSATPSAGTYNAGNGVWTIGDLVNGTPRTLTITAVVRSVNAYLNIASISSENNVDPVGGNNTDQVTIVPCLAGGTVPLFGN